MRQSSLAMFGIATVVASTAALAWPHDDVIEIGNRNIPYQLHAGKNTETGVVNYHAFATRHIDEAGEASTFTHPVDDRRCSWVVQAHIERQVCFTSIMGGTSCNNSMRKELPISINGSNGQPSNFFDHRPCTDAGSQIDSDTHSVVAAVNLQQLSDSDLNGDLASTMRGHGATVTYGQGS